MQRRAILALAVAPLALAACAPGRTIPIPDDADELFADVEAAIASAEALVDVAQSWGVGPETIAAARRIIAQARAYLADAKAALGTGAWKDLATAALRILTGIAFSAVMAPASGDVGSKAEPAKVEMTLRK